MAGATDWFIGSILGFEEFTGCCESKHDQSFAVVQTTDEYSKEPFSRITLNRDHCISQQPAPKSNIRMFVAKLSRKELPDTSDDGPEPEELEPELENPKPEALTDQSTEASDDGPELEALEIDSLVDAKPIDVHQMVSRTSCEELDTNFQLPEDTDLMRVSASISAMAGLPGDQSHKFPGNARSAFLALHAMGRIVVATNFSIPMRFGDLIADLQSTMTPVAIKHGSGDFTWAPADDVVLLDLDRLVLMSFPPQTLAEGLFMNRDLEKQPVQHTPWLPQIPERTLLKAPMSKSRFRCCA